MDPERTPMSAREIILFIEFPHPESIYGGATPQSPLRARELPPSALLPSRGVLLERIDKSSDDVAHLDLAVHSRPSVARFSAYFRVCADVDGQTPAIQRNAPTQALPP